MHQTESSNKNEVNNADNFNNLLPEIKLHELLERSCHIGHKTHSWNPKVSHYIYGSQNDVHIINLIKTIPLLHNAMRQIKKMVSEYKKILFVGTKDQISDIVEKEAQECGQYYVNNRWLGGTLSNWSTIFLSIRKMKKLRRILESEEEQKSNKYTKKELIKIRKQYEKMYKNFKGIERINGLPHLIVVFDVNKDKIAVQEANRMKIPVIGLIDSNSNPIGINFPVPGNDDAIRSVGFFVKCFGDAARVGIKEALATADKKKQDAPKDVRDNKERRFIKKDNIKKPNPSNKVN